MSKDEQYRKLISRARWQKLRARYLTAHPLCERCAAAGTVTAATELHHRRPVEEARTYAEKERIMYDPHNLMALCHACHVAEHMELGKGDRQTRMRRQQRQVEEDRRALMRRPGEGSSVNEC